MPKQPDVWDNIPGLDAAVPSDLDDRPVDADDDPGLCEDAIRAIDSVIGSAIGPVIGSAGDESDQDDESRACAALLSLLDTAVPTNRDVMADVIELRCHKLDAAVRDADARLSVRDADALDAWMLAGGRAARTPSAVRERAERHEALGEVLTHPAGVGDRRASLIERTMGAVAAAERASAPIKMPAAEPSRPSIRWADIGAIAAVLLVAAVVFRPSVDAAASYREGAACLGSLQSLARAMGSYQDDFAGSLPSASASFGGSWWDVGSTPERSNSASLFTLKSGSYATLDELACAGNPEAARQETDVEAHDWRTLRQVSFSYRLPGEGASSRLASDVSPSSAVLVADRSPVVLRAVARQTIRPFDNSPNHDGRWQHILFADGHVKRTASPVLESGDNIWLPNQLERVMHRAAERAGLDLEGRELPASADDVFVGP